MKEIPQRVEIISEEPDFCAQTANYSLRMKQVRDFMPTGILGWMGTVYFKESRGSSFSANTYMRDTRQEAYEEGVGIMNKRQSELDALMD